MSEAIHWTAADDGYARRVRDNFACQAMMQTMGAKLGTIDPGRVQVLFDYTPGYCQQNGFLHAGAITTLLDTAAGYAAYTLMPADANVLSVEFKINLLSPGKGERFSFIGSVVKAGRTLSNVRGEAYAMDAGGKEKLFATMDGTMITVRQPSEA